jgi:hypothetical protein
MTPPKHHTAIPAALLMSLATAILGCSDRESI